MDVTSGVSTDSCHPKIIINCTPVRYTNYPWVASVTQGETDTSAGVYLQPDKRPLRVVVGEVLPWLSPLPVRAALRVQCPS